MAFKRSGVRFPSAPPKQNPPIMAGFVLDEIDGIEPRERVRDEIVRQLENADCRRQDDKSGERIYERAIPRSSLIYSAYYGGFCFG